MTWLRLSLYFLIPVIVMNGLNYLIKPSMPWVWSIGISLVGGFITLIYMTMFMGCTPWRD